jgi:hypothetical protein
MKPGEIEKGKLYSDGKSARVVICVYRSGTMYYASSTDNFMEDRCCTLKRFARWAKYPCVFELQVADETP